MIFIKLIKKEKNVKKNKSIIFNTEEFQALMILNLLFNCLKKLKKKILENFNSKI